MTARLSALSRSVAGKRVIVTGAASGMGRATAHLFADEGARVAVSDIGSARVQAVVDEIVDVHGPESAIGVVADVGSLDALKSLVATVEDAFGGIDVLVNNAGVSMINSAFQDETSFESNWATTLDINLTAHARLIRLCLPALQASGAGRIVNIASTESIVTTAGLAAYAASKAGVVGLTKSFAVELGRHGITVNCICPGPINTGMTAGIDEVAKATYAKRRVPLRRYGDPEEVAHMTVSLCLPASSFVNGAVIPVDGGMTVRHT
ncbi:MAG: putative oxidoreductase [Ilumatobacteraceae bacterium]|nr:putative oxidoreductase [Ilumatobacteraceae bacterium]MCU1387244.1 putative oxidoreductase [Ilumatobacteraceae bacterium]